MFAYAAIVSAVVSAYAARQSEMAAKETWQRALENEFESPSFASLLALGLRRCEYCSRLDDGGATCGGCGAPK